jgi:uncharacterized RDD family membrane protein YckC
MNTNYAGFWLRFVAWFIDSLILGVLEWFIIVPILATIGFASNFSYSDLQNVEDISSLVAIGSALIGLAWVVNRAILILYHSVLESSKFQGSIGKMALQLIVTDVNGQKLDFGKAFVRNLCKLISNITLAIGYIVAGFTDKKQALHDIIAGTLVVKKSSGTSAS